MDFLGALSHLQKKYDDPENILHKKHGFTEKKKIISKIDPFNLFDLTLDWISHMLR